mmetsp:Transcript_9584/g.18705  ORF Transcript_9584/g.18705 Transcript_9584/m.18705 type:complete len:80 (+) Transcript_9584:7262-7501(+)
MEERLAQAIQEAAIGMMLRDSTSTCYKMCVASPSDTLTNDNKRCLAMCQDRFQEAFEKTFFNQYKRYTEMLEASQHSSH